MPQRRKHTPAPPVPRLDNYRRIHIKLVPVLDEGLVDGLLEIVASSGKAAGERARRKLFLHLEDRRVVRDLQFSRGLREAVRLWEALYVDAEDAPDAPPSAMKHTTLLVETDKPYFRKDFENDLTAVGVPE